MSAEDDYYHDDDEDSFAPEEDAAESGAGDDEPSGGPQKGGFRDWLTAKRGWLLIVGLTVAQGLFAVVVVALRDSATPPAAVTVQEMRQLAVDMLGHEVGINQIHQVIPMRGGKRFTVGLDLVLVLGQLPAERVEGADRPTPEEFEVFLAAVRDMEPRIRSQVNILLQKIPPEDYGDVEVYRIIKEDVKNFANDTLAGLDFGKGVRPGIDKRRVTEVLLPMFVRQNF